MTEPSIVVPEHDFYDAARRRIEHEDTLNVNRLSWLMASQSFLFSAFAVVVNGLVEKSTLGLSPYQPYSELLFRMIPMLGLISCVSYLHRRDRRDRCPTAVAKNGREQYCKRFPTSSHWSVTYALAGSGRSDGASAGFHCGVDDTLPAALA